MTDGDDIEVQQQTQGEALILTPIGEIDLSRAPALRTHLGAALKTGPRRLVIDLKQVPYMDSSGVATFVEAMQLARRADSELILCGLQDRVRSVFEIARLDMVFKILTDTEEALAT
ncbi:MAG: STAS domain-containing protein [Phycisphaerales bacterium]|nr:STAS domain-containing protein [Phycisphaerae bacterium]NNF43986.1 STAS domain-containing protein [Phycisphaerales bacterium]NNM27790.1 STAS domain-containing protein [Phycisphaerales bacterium]